MEEVLVDSAIDFDEAVSGLVFPDAIKETLTLIDIEHLSFDGRAHRGQMLLNKRVAEEVQTLFAELYTLRFPIHKIVPIVAYGWDDDASMSDNNSSAFNYRRVYGTDELSNHSYGLALDINPLQNPYIARDGSIHPPLATHESNAPGTFFEGAPQTDVFLSRGWEWGGRWPDRKDWQHFQKLS